MACEKPQSSDVLNTQIERKNSNEGFYMLDSGKINIPFKTNNNEQVYILDPETGRVEYKFTSQYGWQKGGFLPSFLSFKNSYQNFCDFESDFKKMANHKSGGFLAVKPEYIEAVYAQFYKPKQIEDIQAETGEKSNNLKQEIQKGDYAFQDIPNLEQEKIDLAISHLKAALNRLTENARFREITGVEKGDINKMVLEYLPLMVKESLLVENAESRANGPYGYFQIDEGASNDARRFIGETLNVRKTYDRKDPEDNCILGVVYFILMKENLETLPLLDLKDVDKFTLFSYNAGLGNTKDVISLYSSENLENKNISWDEFASWITKKMGYKGIASIREDVVYLGQYHDWFDVNSELRADEKIHQNIDASRGKIFEAINYVEKITNISSHVLLTKGDLVAREAEQLEVIDHISIKFKKGSSIYSILKDQDINKKHAHSVFDFNKEHNPDFKNTTSVSTIPANINIWIPKWSTGFYNEIVSNEVESKKQQTVEKELKGKFDFDSWIQSIDVIGNKLKGKVFILDPGHGGPDLGAHPVARGANGKPIPDFRSSVKYIREGRTQRVTSGKGSDYLHVYESLVTVDVSYRLAKLLRQQGATVHMTRYNKTTGIIDNANMTTPHTNEDIYSDSKKSWKYSRDGQAKRLKRGVFIGNSIFAKSGKKEKDVYFLSIHADSLGGNMQPPITFKYYKGRAGTSGTGKAFADKLAAGIEFRSKQAVSDGQALYIVHPNKNRIKQSVLVELANMGDPNSAYVLRQPGTLKDENGNIIPGRKQFADALFSGIIASVK